MSSSAPLLDDFTDANPGERAGGLDVAMVLRRKWWIVLCAIIGVVLGVLKYARTSPVFETRSQILVQEKAQPTALDTSTLTGTDTSKSPAINHAHVMACQRIVSTAVETHALQQLPSLATTGDATTAIRNGLRVSPLGNDVYSGIYTISFRSPNPQDGQEVIEAVVDTYRSFLGESDQNVSAELVTLIESAQSKLSEQLEKHLADYHERFYDGEQLLMNEGEFVNVHQERQAKIENRRDELRFEIGSLEARLQATEKALTEGAQPEALLIALESNRDNRFASGDKPSSGPNVRSLEVELAELTQSYGRKHPKVRAVERRLDVLRKFEQQDTEANAASEQELVQHADTPRELLTLHVESLKRQKDAAEEELSQLNQMNEKEEAAAKRLAREFSRRREHLERIDRTKQTFNAVVKQLNDVSLIKDVGGDRYRIDTLEPAGTGIKVAPSLPRFLGMGLVLGVMGGLGLAYLIDRADERLTTPDDVANVVPVPVVGQIPALTGKLTVIPDSSLAPELVAAHQPKSAAAEAFRVLRTAIYFGTKGKTFQLIQVTSALPGDGKSTLVSNLAISMAQSGKRVLLIDADLRKPVQHKRFHLANDKGLSDVIEGRLVSQQVIQATPIANLSLLPCGKLPANPAELLSSPQFNQLLESLKSHYQFILIDTPPLLAVSDPSAVAARVDAVLLAVRIGVSSRGEVRQAYAVLQELDATVMGTVVNGLDERKRYGYGYRYGYRARYGQGYRYGYRSYLDAGPGPDLQASRRPDVSRATDDEFAPLND